MTATYAIGDVFDRLAEVPDGSVDLIVTSPPYLALRSYLPADHPDKAREIGSERTPADFLDVMLRLTAEWRRVLAPHGSIAIELADTFSGSGGSGGDYVDGGWRSGQPPFGGSASRGRESGWSYPDALWLAGVIDTEGSIHVHRNDRGDKSPSYVVWVRISMMDREVCDRAAAITGVGNVTQDKRGAYTWGVSAQQARYVLLNIWPYLLIKQRQAKAGIELARRIEDYGGRGVYAPVEREELAWREMVKEYVTGLNARGDDRGRYQPTWEPPEPHRIRHSAIGGAGWPLAKSLAMIPELYRVGLAYGVNPLTGEASPAGRWRVRNVVRRVSPNPPPGALGDKWRPATSEIVVACTSGKRYWDDVATRRPANPAHKGPSESRREGIGGRTDQIMNPLGADGQRILSNPAGAPLNDWWEIASSGYDGAHYATFSPQLVEPFVKAMGPRRVCRVCGEPERRVTGEPTYERTDTDRVPARLVMNGGDRKAEKVNQFTLSEGANTSVVRQVETVGFTDCGHDDFRPGLVLDPFAGTGTTLAVATGHGLDALGFDLDERNADLAVNRVGPLMLTVVGKGDPLP